MRVASPTPRSPFVGRDRELSLLRPHLAIPPDRPAAEVLTHVATGFAALLCERASLIRLVPREAQVDRTVATEPQRMIHESVELLAGYLDARIRAGELRPHDARLAANGRERPIRERAGAHALPYRAVAGDFRTSSQPFSRPDFLASI